MDTFIKFGLVVSGIIGLVFFAVIAGVMFGGLFAMFIAWIFNDTWATVTEAFGWTLSPWATGALFGFIGGFVRFSVANNTRSKD